LQNFKQYLLADDFASALDDDDNDDDDDIDI